jgi:hypothetical protein
VFAQLYICVGRELYVYFSCAVCRIEQRCLVALGRSSATMEKPKVPDESEQYTLLLDCVNGEKPRTTVDELHNAMFDVYVGVKDIEDLAPERLKEQWDASKRSVDERIEQKTIESEKAIQDAVSRDETLAQRKDELKKLVNTLAEKTKANKDTKKQFIDKSEQLKTLKQHTAARATEVAAVIEKKGTLTEEKVKLEATVKDLEHRHNSIKPTAYCIVTALLPLMDFICCRYSCNTEEFDTIPIAKAIVPTQGIQPWSTDRSELIRVLNSTVNTILEQIPEETVQKNADQSACIVLANMFAKFVATIAFENNIDVEIDGGKKLSDINDITTITCKTRFNFS